MEEIWWLSNGNEPSLYSSVAFVVLLFFWLSIACTISAAMEKKAFNLTEWFIAAGVPILFGATGLVLWVIWDSVELENYHRYGNPPRSESYLEALVKDSDMARARPHERWREYQVLGVWEVETDSDLFPRSAKYLIIWRNERFQILNDQYLILAEGGSRISPPSYRNAPDHWKDSGFYLFGDEGFDFYGSVTSGPGRQSEFVVSIAGGTRIIDRFEEYFQPSTPVTLRLKNRRMVHSSYPIPLSATYPFYDDTSRESTPGNRLNPDALYP